MTDKEAELMITLTARISDVLERTHNLLVEIQQVHAQCQAMMRDIRDYAGIEEHPSAKN